MDMLARQLLIDGGGGGAFSAPANPLAYETLTRYGATPVLTRGGAGTWDADTVAGEQVFFDDRLNRWVMAYVGIDAPLAEGGVIKFGIAYSDDLLVWEKEAANPVFSPNVAEENIATMNVMQLADETYRAYYQSYGDVDAEIYAAESDDLLTWTRLNGGAPVLALGTSGEWDDTAVFDPAPFLIGTETYLWYGGQKADLTRGIGLATAADGITFTRQGRLFTPAAGESNVSYGAPALLVTSATDYKVWYDAADTATNTTRYICHNDTTDGSTFSHEHQFLIANPAGWDNVQVFDAAPIVYQGVLYLFYAGSPSTGSGTELSPDIGLATMAWP